MEHRECWLCGRNGAQDPLDRHHLFGGPLRNKSEKYGLVVDLCHHRCHIFGKDAAHKSRKTIRKRGEVIEDHRLHTLWQGKRRDRTDIIHEGMEVLPLCREHHAEAHTMPDAAFFEKYHIPGGIVMDKTLCRLYGLKARR